MNKYTLSYRFLNGNVHGCVFAKNRPVSLNWSDYTINVFDSAFNDIGKESKSQIASILKFDGKCLKLQKVPVQHQAGGSDSRNAGCTGRS